MSRLNYTVLIGFPKAGGHYAVKGEKLDLLDVEARALRQAGRIKLTSEIEAEAAAAATAATTTKAAKVAAKDAE